MALNEIEIKALNELKSSLEYSVNSIYDLLRNDWIGDDEKADEIKTLISDWSTIRHDEFGILENGRQNGDNIKNLKILETFLILLEKPDKEICQGCNSNQNGNLIEKLLDKTELMRLCPNCIKDLKN